jgi:TPR repeat protein
MKEKERFPHVAIGAFIMTSLGGHVSHSSAEEVFAVKEVQTMQRCYWLSREIPGEGLCGEKMRPDTAVLKREAVNGNTIAAMRLGQLYGSGNWGVTQDVKEAIKWYARAAELGDRYSQLQLAHTYEYGRMNVEKDIRKAIYYYRMATENGIYPQLEKKLEQLERKLATKK